MRQMKVLSIIDDDPVMTCTFSAIVFTTLAQCLFSQKSELTSELLAWLILPFIFKATRTTARKNNTLPSVISLPVGTSPKHERVSTLSCWVVASCLSCVSFYKAEQGMIYSLSILTPLLLVILQKLQSAPYSSLATPWLSASTFLTHTFTGTTIVAIFTITWTHTGNRADTALSLIPVSLLLIVYVAFLPKTEEKSGRRPFPSVDFEDAIIPLSCRVLASLLIAIILQTALFGFTRGSVLHTALAGGAKALAWYFTIQASRHSSWLIATTIGTFSLTSTCDPFIQPTEIQALSHVLSALLSLGQTINIIPPHAKLRSAIWGLSLISVVPYFASLRAIHFQPHGFSSSTSSTLNEHPVEALVRNANADFQALLDRQSTTYQAARDEYTRRHGIDPPAGFEGWFDFAKRYKSPIIDDFDIIHDSISPLLKVSGRTINEAISQLQERDDTELWMCSFDGATARTSCKHKHRTFDRDIGLLFNTLLGDLTGVLPNVEFLVNHLDEPVVLTPPTAPANRTISHPVQSTSLKDLSRQPIWDEITKYCTNSQSRTDNNRSKSPTYPFVTNTSSGLDICQHAEYQRQHGFLSSPTSFRLIEGFVPILSTGSPSTMGDILFPSPAYIESEFQYDETHDVDWDKKRNNLYWAGSTTGGYPSTTSTWQQLHRQRFVGLAQSLHRQYHTYLRQGSDMVHSVKSVLLNGRLYDVSFTRIFQCPRLICREQRGYFRTKSWAPKDEAHRSKLVFDLDGNGISGRYYKLLASKSTPLKQTIFREWHDDRLIPWLHYVPVSLGLEDLPELVSYLASTDVGRRTAKHIADHGRDWHAKAFRDTDKAVYMYRLLLELARLQDPSRQAS